ncbi:bZIP transcription factor 11-like [Syzygium oleosum]|uniref:bZIP transcription factor 11-like n=1 Tax=Syzygium oleosum TaxID=219896 RepID=UPI0011D22BAF|nr:bZIP transcription factor 11-like [Syzygium oleosum]
MGSSSGTSSGSTLIQNSGSEENLQALMDQRKRKRMISNRESARRSRMRKQKLLDDLMIQAAQLRKDNHQLGNNVNIVSQHCMSLETENSILRVQMNELTHRLESLNEILGFLNAGSGGGFYGGGSGHGGFGSPEEVGGGGGVTDQPIECFFNPMSCAYVGNQPILASADMFQY